jgi:hypothetical protein
LDIHFTVGTSYERAAPLAEKKTAAGLSDFSVLSQEFRTVKWMSNQPAL